MKKKILILTPWFPTSANCPLGASVGGIFVADQAQALASLFDVAVMHVILSYENEANWSEKFRSIPVYQFIQKVPFPMSTMMYHKHFVTHSLALITQVFEQWGIPDLIHTHVVLPGGLTSAVIGNIYHIPVVLTEHTGPFSVHLGTKETRQAVRYSLSNINRIIAVSPFLANQMRTFLPDLEVDVVGNVVGLDFEDQPLSHKATDNKQFIFFSLGLMEDLDQKGFPYLLKACQILQKKGITPINVYIGGDGESRKYLEKYASLLGVAERCHFLGLLSRAEVLEWMMKSDVFVLPSLRETFGVVLTEALACGKPVLTTYCGGCEYVVTPECGVLVEKENPIALAKAMQGFIEGEYTFYPFDLRQNVMERFGRESFEKRISAIYGKVWDEVENDLVKEGNMFDNSLYVKYLSTSYQNPSLLNKLKYYLETSVYILLHIFWKVKAWFKPLLKMIKMLLMD